MKKLICLICIMLMSCGQVFAKENYIPSDVADTEYENAYEILTGLSVFDYNTDGSFRPLTPITRGDFAVALGNIMKNNVLSGNVYFEDVTKEHRAFDAVDKLAGCGVINGIGGGVFYPEENIKAIDAIKMLVTSMGYSVRAEQLGGYPDGYIQMAHSIGLFKGVKLENNGELLRGEAAKLLLNALELPVMSASFQREIELSIDKDEDFLYAAMGIKKIKGKVNANDLYSVDGGLTAPEYCLRIDNTVYYAPQESGEDLIGYNVICYFYENAYDENEVIYIQKNIARTDVITVSATDAEDFDFPYFYYGNEKKSKTDKISVSDDLFMIYNGMPETTIEKKDFLPANGELTFIDGDNDGKYDIVKIKTYHNAVVSSVTEDAIYISYPNNGKIKFDDYDTVVLYNKEGNEISYSELKENDVISLYESKDKTLESKDKTPESKDKTPESKDKTLINIVYSRERITGTVSKSYEEDGVIKVVIDDNLYNVASDYDKSFPFMLSIGTNGTFCLDANGDVYTMMGETTTTRKYGYFIRVWESVEDESVCVRLLEENGKVVDRILSDKIKMDGDSTLKSANVYRLLVGVKPSPVVYKTNRIGEITMLDTVLQGENNEDDSLRNEDDSLRKVNTGVSGMYRSRTMCFNFALPIDVDTKFFIVPEEEKLNKINELGVADYKILQNEVTYNNMDSYSVSDKLTADIVVMNNNSSLNTVIGIVTSVKRALNNDEEEVDNYTVQSGSGQNSYSVAEAKVSEEIHEITEGSGNDKTTLLADVKKVHEGDLVKLYLNNAGEIEKISMIYGGDDEKGDDEKGDDEKGKKLRSKNPNVADANVTSFERYILGEIKEIDKNIVAIAPKLKTGTSTSLEYYNMKDKKIYIYNESSRSGDRIIEGKSGDLEKGDIILIVTKGGLPQYAIAY